MAVHQDPDVPVKVKNKPFQIRLLSESRQAADPLSRPVRLPVDPPRISFAAHKTPGAVRGIVPQRLSCISVPQRLPGKPGTQGLSDIPDPQRLSGRSAPQQCFGGPQWDLLLRDAESPGSRPVQNPDLKAYDPRGRIAFQRPQDSPCNVYRRRPQAFPHNGSLRHMRAPCTKGLPDTSP